jgi:hypothetical protein
VLDGTAAGKMIREILLYVVAFGFGFAAALAWMVCDIRRAVDYEVSRFLRRSVRGSDN